jgi:hypothetical protein
MISVFSFLQQFTGINATSIIQRIFKIDEGKIWFILILIFYFKTIILIQSDWQVGSLGPDASLDT